MKNKHRYSQHWWDTIRPAILKRDGYKCKEPGCNVRHKAVGYYNLSKQWVECDSFMSDWASKNNFKVQQISLQVAHLDQDPSNNSDENLRSYCPKHHLNYDRQFNLLKRKTSIASRAA